MATIKTAVSTVALPAGLALLLVLGAMGTALAGPKGVRATYAATMNGVGIGTITEQFQIEGTSYRIVSDTKPAGLAALIQRQPLRFTSHGRVTRAGLQPVRFEARRTVDDPPQMTADFDWPAGQLVMMRNGNSQSVALPAGTQDRLSIMYQFMFVPLGSGSHVEFPMTNGRKLDRYRYRILRETELETPMGRLKTLHLAKERDPGDTSTEVWLSPQHRNLPVKVTLVERNGIRYEQVIQSVDIRD